MATRATKATKTAAAQPAPETPESGAAPETPESEHREAAATITKAKAGVPDRVAAVSYRADGTPDQTPDFEVLGEQSDEGPSDKG